MTKEWKQEERLFLHLGNARDTGGSGRRYFSRGGVKYALLELLSHENMHGYQMMKALEEQSGGTYKPSAGSIYPTLQMLRDQGLVEPYKQDGKRIFQITEEGRAYLQEEMERPEPLNAAEQGGNLLSSATTVTAATAATKTSAMRTWIRRCPGAIGG